MRARICLALKLSPGRLPRQTRKLPTTAPQMKRPTRRTRMLNAQARSVRGDALEFRTANGGAARLGDVTLVNPE